MTLVMFSGLLGFLAVALGAFGAHALEGRLAGDAAGWWSTATLYALAHAPAALAASLGAEQSKHLARAASFFLIGAALFSGSLYALALGGPHALVFVTPIGGACLLLGWGFIIAAGFVRRP